MAIPLIEIGKYNHLEVLKSTEQGLYVGDDIEEILLPNKYIPEGLEVGDHIDVFIYNDSEDRMIATTLQPKIQVGEFAYLQVKDVTSIGAFLDWGLEKDLLVPFKEQLHKMEPGKFYVVYMYLDEVTDRLVASSHLNKFIEREVIDLEEGQEVDLLIGDKTDLGYQVIINNRYRGLIFQNEIFRKVDSGDCTVGFVKRVREDKKIDISLEKQGYQSIEPNADRIYEVLKANEGFLPLTDKSDPEEIQLKLQMSKKNFKKAIGTLYKKRMIRLEPKGIRLI